MANKYASGDMTGFVSDLHKAGAPLDDFNGVFADRQKRGGGGYSQHAYGNAIDIERGFEAEVRIIHPDCMRGLNSIRRERISGNPRCAPHA